MRGWPLFVVVLPAIAFAQPVPGTCTGDCPSGPIPALLSSVRDASGALETCQAVYRRRGSLRNVKNASRELDCRDGAPCAVKAVIDQVAREQGVPADLLYAVAWTESNWKQWRADGTPVISRGGDVGLLQLSPQAWGNQFDMTEAGEDLLYNARAGAKVLAWAMRISRRNGYSGVDLYRSTYAIFNGGPGAVNRPWRDSKWAAHDRNFERHLRRRPWAPPVRGCI